MRLPDPKRTRRHGGLFVLVIPPCKISPKLNGTAPHFGDEMFGWYFLFATWMAVVKILLWMSQHGTAVSSFYERSTDPPGRFFPIEDFIDGFWRPAQEYGDFNYCNCTRVSSPPKTAPVSINAGCQYPRDVATVYDQTRNDSTCNSLPFWAFT